MTAAEMNKVDKARAKEEAQLAQRILGVFQRRLEEMMPTADKSMNRTFQLGEAERQLLLQINNLGLKEGALAGIVTLVLLRKVRSSFFKRLVQQRDRMMAQSHQQQQANHHVHNSPFASQQQQYGGINAPQQLLPDEVSKLNSFIKKRSSPFTFMNMFGWMLDSAVAFSIAASTSLLLTDRKKILHTVSQIPLTPGTSQISKEFCPSLLQEMATLHRQDVHAADMLEHPQTATLQAFTNFAKNCHLRQSYEQQFRRQHGLFDADPVVVPHPGVKQALLDAGYSTSTSEFLSSNNEDDEHGEHRYDAEASFSSSSSSSLSDQFQAGHVEDWADEFTTTDQNGKNSSGTERRK